MADRFARAAAMIAVLTVLSRFVGFGRVLVFNWSIGPGDLGDAYQAANTVPNIIFEIVAGGALAALVVPLLAGPAAAADTQRIRQLVSAVLTWVVGGLAAVAIGVALGAEPLVRLLIERPDSAAVEAGAAMLRVFAPQLPLYGVGIVLTGVLQTYRRFAWPALAPLLSSLTVVAAYLTFVAVAGRGVDAAEVGPGGLAVLSVGTTLGVAVLSLCLLVPVRRLRLGLRPALRLPPGATGLVRKLAVAGVVTVAAQQLALVLAIALAGRGPAGTVVLYGLAQTIFLLPWAVLALPVATSAYPGLAEAGAAGDRAGFARRLAPAARSVTLLSGLGTVVLLTVAGPASGLLTALMPQAPDSETISVALAAFAPGLVGYALFALLSRALYARGAQRAVAVATGFGWAVVALASLVCSAAFPVAARVTALAVANSIGSTALGAAVLVAVARRAGRAALAGLGRAALTTLAAGVVALVAGLGLGWLLGAPPLPGFPGAATPGPLACAVQGMLSGLVVGAGYVSVAALLDRQDTRPMLVAVAHRICRAGGVRRPRKGSS